MLCMYVDMVELVDTLYLEFNFVKSIGSSPVIYIHIQYLLKILFIMIVVIN